MHHTRRGRPRPARPDVRQPGRRALLALLVAAALTALNTAALPARPASAAEGFTTLRTTPAGDRFETSASIARMAFPDGARDAYLVNGDNPVDALASSPLAGTQAPILYTHRDDVPQPVLAVLRELGVSRLHVVGGRGVVSDTAATRAAAALTPGPGTAVSLERIAGGDRYETAAVLARRVMTLNLGSQDTVLVVSGDTLADALSAAPQAATARLPLLLTSREELPSATQSALEDLTGLRPGLVRPRWVEVVGGPGAVSEAVVQQIRSGPRPGDPEQYQRWVYRMSGADRYETSALMAASTAYAPVAVGLANGQSLVDALPGAVLLARSGSPILLTRPTELGAAAVGYLAEKQAGLRTGIALGGAASVPDHLLTQARIAATAPAISALVPTSTDTSTTVTVESRADYRFEAALLPATPGAGPNGYAPIAAAPPAGARRVPFPAPDARTTSSLTIDALTPGTRYDVWLTRTVADLPATTLGTVAVTTAAPPSSASVRAVPGAVVVSAAAPPAGVRWQVHVEPAATTADGRYLPPQAEPVGVVPYPNEGPARTWWMTDPFGTPVTEFTAPTAVSGPHEVWMRAWQPSMTPEPDRGEALGQASQWVHWNSDRQALERDLRSPAGAPSVTVPAF